MSRSHPRSVTGAFALAVLAVALTASARAAVVTAGAFAPQSATKSESPPVDKTGHPLGTAPDDRAVAPLSARLSDDAIFARWIGAPAPRGGSVDFDPSTTLEEQANALPEAERVPSFLVEPGPGEGGDAGNGATVETIDGPLSGAKAAWRHGDWDVYISGYAYHLPGYYTAARRAKLNANEWGGGLGRSIDDQKGNRHLLFFLVTQDSHYKPQYFAGYSWLHPLFPESPVQLDFGISAFFFSRVDVADGIPLPGLLPFLTLGTKRVQLIVLYVPPIGKEIGGQTIYFYSRIQL